MQNIDNKNKKEKIISFIAGIVVGGIIVFLYGNLTAPNLPIPPDGMGDGMGMGGNRNMDISQMSDEQLEKIAERQGITVEELKSKIKNK